MKSIISYIIIFLSCSAGLFGQGKIMLVGGGSEDAFTDSPNWSNIPYQWAVNQSANKRVAVITFNTNDATTFLPNYFLDLGAVAAKNFVIGSHDDADSPITYDSLITYDVFFFKGGNQADYYETYRDSKVSEAITDKFQAGGVICGTSAGMAILSEVIFPALEGTVYPDETLENSNRTDIILKNDFVNILPNYITDSHFIERGRFPRIISFMGKWKQEQQENIAGIGVDDQTAFCIDENGIGTSYGNGAVSIFTLADYTTTNDKPVVDEATVVHLLHGKQYDVTNQDLVSTYATTISAESEMEMGNYTLYLAGTATYGHNLNLLDDLVTAINTPMTIVTRKNSTKINSYLDYLNTNSTETVHVIYTDTNPDSCSTVEDRNAIRSSNAFILLDNAENQLFDFIANHPTGQLLKTQLFRDGNILAFLGEDAKYAGQTYVTNNTTDDLNAFYGELTFETGLGLLGTTSIMPDAFPSASTAFYENNSAAVSYAMVKNRLKYGIYINEQSYLKFYQQDGKNWVDGFGKSSSILLTNQSEKGDLASEAVNSAGDTRNVVGFEQMTYSLLAGNPQQIGEPVARNISEGTLELIAPTLSSSKNADESITLTWNSIANSTDYQLERSVNAGSFVEIATLSTNQTAYTDTDTEVQNQYRYRVQAVNGSQVSCYSAETSPILTSLENDLFPTLYFPNPITTGAFQLHGLEGKTVGISIYNVQGQLVFRQAIYRESDQIKVANFVSGLYILRLHDHNNIGSYKIRIQH